MKKPFLQEFLDICLKCGGGFRKTRLRYMLGSYYQFKICRKCGAFNLKPMR